MRSTAGTFTGRVVTERSPLQSEGTIAVVPGTKGLVEVVSAVLVSSFTSTLLVKVPSVLAPEKSSITRT